MSAELAPRGRGQPTKLTADTQARFLEAIGKGASYKLAAQYAGIGERTFHDWATAAEDDDEATPPYYGRAAAFLAALKAAEAAYSLHRLEAIALAGGKPEHWTAAAWLVERRHPEYRQNVRHEHGGAVAHTLQLVDLAAVRPRPDLPPGAGTWNGHAIETTARDTTPPEGMPPSEGATGG